MLTAPPVCGAVQGSAGVVDASPASFCLVEFGAQGIWNPTPVAGCTLHNPAPTRRIVLARFLDELRCSCARWSMSLGARRWRAGRSRSMHLHVGVGWGGGMRGLPRRLIASNDAFYATTPYLKHHGVRASRKQALQLLPKHSNHPLLDDGCTGAQASLRRCTTEGIETYVGSEAKQEAL